MEVLLEMERSSGRAKAEDQGCCSLGSGPSEGLRACQPLCGLGLGDALLLPKEDLASEYFEHQRRMQFEGCAAEPHMTITAILPGSKWSCLRLRRTVCSRLPDCATSQ